MYTVLNVKAYDLPLVAVVVVWNERPVIEHIHLVGRGCSVNALRRKAFPHAIEKSGPWVDRRVEKIRDLLSGRTARIALKDLALESCSPFQQTVLRALYALPKGQVISYGKLAERVGKPRAARAVGTAMARNPFPLVIPCHRVIRAGGDVGRFQGGRSSGPALKRALLGLEGVVV